LKASIFGRQSSRVELDFHPRNWNVEESRVFNEWKAKAEAKAVAKAEVKALRSSFVDVVENRFPGGMSPEL